MADEFDDPLIGVVNLFDIAMVFAVALVVALVFTSDSAIEIPNPGAAPEAPRGGQEVGRVLQLPDGRLVYTLESDRGE